jgi:EAL domain-containing protein (putative c-di-GMP-specific phosphodiesterase class I)
LLIQVAARLKETLREDDTIARLGGDEFILVLPDTGVRGSSRVAEKVMVALSRPYRSEQHELIVTPSMGVAIYPDDGSGYEELSRCADAAMYRAKDAGRNTFRFFTREMQEHSDRVLSLENALRRALELGQLQLHYQPQISLENNRVIGVEALLRWTHPELGVISPSEFIPISEDSGLILTVGEWVLRTAIAQLKTWQGSGSDIFTPLVMAVNISAVQFLRGGLPDLVSDILAEYDLQPDCLELELTEGVALGNPDEAIKRMEELHARGVRLSIDDFGTGYSSLSYLKRFNAYKLKIDQSFVRDISSDPDDKAIVEAIISMARSLGMKTIAEGVETAEQMAYLYDRDCDEAQGYFIAKPMPADAFEDFVRNFKLLG